MPGRLAGCQGKSIWEDTPASFIIASWAQNGNGRRQAAGTSGPKLPFAKKQTYSAYRGGRRAESFALADTPQKVALVVVMPKHRECA